MVWRNLSGRPPDCRRRICRADCKRSIQDTIILSYEAETAGNGTSTMD